MSEKQLSFDGAMKIVGEQKWIQIKDIERLEKFIQNQQATIERLEKENKELGKNFDDLVNWASEIANRNVVLDEQIGRLQQEIRLLKPTNIEQYEQIVRLQEENEQLRKELNDCEKFRYIVFKRLNDEYIKECSIK